MELNPKELAVLTIINEEPTHGYLLLKKVEERNYPVWTEISVPTVYRIISTLENKNLISAKLEQNGQGAPKKVYTLTRKGKDTLKTGLIINMSSPTTGISSFDISLAGINLINRQEALKALEKYRESLNIRLNMMNANRAHSTGLWHVEALFKHGEIRIEAENRFIEWLEKEIKEKMNYHSISALGVND